MPVKINEVRDIARKIDGWLLDKEGMLLYRLANRCKGKGVIVEIGSWKGKSTVWLGSGSRHGKRIPIYAIDPHTGSKEHREALGKVWTFEEFKRNIQDANIADIIKPLVKTSQAAAREIKEPVELIFIDGAHDYDSTKLDLELWMPKVINGGMMIFHDTVGQSGAKKVIEEYVYRSRKFRNVRFLRSITFAEKVEKNSLFDRFRNRYVLFLKDKYEMACNSRLPRPVKKIWKKMISLAQF